MNVPPDRSATLERERRWMRPAGIAAIVGSIAFQVGLYVGGAALEGDSTSERLLEASKGDADGQLLLGVVISGLGFLLMGAALTHLFLAARARSPRVLRQLVALPLVGAAMVAGGLILNNFSYTDAADSFAASEAEREAAPVAPAEPQSDQKSDGAADQKSGGGGGEEPEGKAAGGESGAEGKIRTVEPTTTTTETTQTSADESEEDAEDAADERADDALADASGSALSALLIRGGALAFAIGFLYTSLWSMRTGLLSRFWGSLGMASAVVLALFFLYFFGLIWFLALGMLLVGAWVGGRPPAWESGTAIPWPKAGEQPDARDPLAGEDRDAVEGEGREVEPSEGEASGPDEPPGEPPRKRKRRQ